MKILSGKYIVPAWICGGFFLILILWVSHQLFLSYSVQREYRKNIDNAVYCVIDKTMAFNIGETQEAKAVRETLISEFHKSAGDDLDALGRKINLLSYIFLIGCSTIFLIFLSWSYAIRNRVLMARIDAVLSKKEQIDELGLAAAGLAHETKNPLGVIRGLAQNIASDGSNSAEIRKKARDIMEETDVTTARLGDFLSYARFRSPVSEEINAVEYFERIMDLLTDDFDNTGVELNSEITPSTMLADPDMLSQIMMNLLTNSLKFTKKGGVVTLSFDIKRSKYGEIKVIDTGAGIEPELLSDIFKPYVTKGVGGYGIGLAIVNRIVDQSGWKISVKSKENKGTTFTISNIPIKVNV